MVPPERIRSNTFVGRDKELEVFQQFIETTSIERILNIHSLGLGGIGKTQLLYQMQKICEHSSSQFFCIKNLLDFYHIEARSRIGIMQQIAANLGSDDFSEFKQLLPDYYTTEDVSEREVMFSNLEKAFKNDYLKFSLNLEKKKKTFVLFFDTYEIIQRELAEEHKVESTEFSHWVETRLFPLLFERPNVRIVVSGRYPLRETGCLQPLLKIVPLEHFTEEETIKFLKRCFKIENDSDNSHLIEKILCDARTVYELTDGRPILLALFADLINHNREKWCNIWKDINIAIFHQNGKITSTQKEIFEDGLIHFFTTEEKSTIINMALAYHRMTPQMLHFIINLDDEISNKPPLEKCESILLADLKPLSFIKYKENEIVVLHDEMRRLVENRLKKLNLLSETRKDISERCIVYYETTLLSSKSLEEADREIYTSELIEYAFFADPMQGLKRFQDEFDIALDDGRYDYAAILLHEAEMFRHNNPEEIGFPDYLQIELRNIRYYTRTDKDYTKAWEMVNNAIARYDKNLEWKHSEIQAHFLLEAGVAAFYLDKFEEAVTIFRQSKNAFYDVGDDYWMHRTNNWIGYALYRQGKFREAEKDFHQSREGFYRLLMQEEDLQESRRRLLFQGLKLTLVNLARMYSYTGEFDWAIYNAEMASILANYIPRNSMEIARTYATAADVFTLAGQTREAESYINELTQLIKKIDSRLIEGRAKITESFLSYRVNEFSSLLEYYRAEEISEVIEKYVDRKSSEEKAKLEKARELLENAKDILERRPPIKKELADAYYALGELYMITPISGHWKKAEDAFKKSLTFGEQSQFRYRVIDTLESLVALYYFWNGSSEKMPPEKKEQNQEEMKHYQHTIEESKEYKEKTYPESLSKYEITLGDMQYDDALQFPDNDDVVELDKNIALLKDAFRHYILAAELMESVHSERYYLILRVFYNRLRTLIKKALQEKVMIILPRLEELRLILTDKNKKFTDLYRYGTIDIQSLPLQDKLVEDLCDHAQRVLHKGNYGWALLLNECLIEAYRARLSSYHNNVEDREQLILSLTKQCGLFRILEETYQAAQSINAAKEELRFINDDILKHALEGYIEAIEGTLYYRRGEYGRLLEFYLRDELENVRQYFDRQFPDFREKTLQQLQNGEEKLLSAIQKFKKLEHIRRYRKILGDIKFRIGEWLISEKLFEDRDDQKGAFSYLKETIELAKDIDDNYRYDNAIQRYLNALYFSEKYNSSTHQDDYQKYENLIEKRIEESQLQHPSMLGRFRITQGDILFNECFEYKKDVDDEQVKYVSIKGKNDARKIRRMLRYYVEACNFMAQHSTINFDIAIRVLKRRIDLIADREALAIIQKNLCTVWENQRFLKEKINEFTMLNQFARIKEITLEI